MHSVDHDGVIDELVCWGEKSPQSFERHALRFRDAAELDYFTATSRGLLPGAIQDWRDWRDPPKEGESEVVGHDLPSLLKWHGERPDLPDEMVDEIWGGLEVDRDADEGDDDDDAQRFGPDFGSRIQIIEDRKPGNVFPGGDPRAFARDYERELPAGWRESIILLLSPSEPVVIARWTPERVLISVTKRWAERQPEVGSGDYARPRWRVLEKYFAENDCERVAIPPTKRTGRGSIRELKKAGGTLVPVEALSTGLKPLDDALARSHGVPRRGARCFVQGGPSSGKTSMLFEVACSYVDRGFCVAWYATADEPEEAIEARKRQRYGNAVPDGFIVIDGRDEYLEDLLAHDGFDFLFVDSLQEARTRDGEGAGEQQRIDAARKLISESGLTAWVALQKVRAWERRPDLEGSKGGSGNEYLTTLLLDVRRPPKGTEIAVKIVKSRALGGEGETIRLELDADRQRVTAPGADAADDDLRDEICAALAAGPMSRNEVHNEVGGRKATVLKAIACMVDAGELRDDGSKVALPSGSQAREPVRHGNQLSARNRQ